MENALTVGEDDDLSIYKIQVCATKMRDRTDWSGEKDTSGIILRYQISAFSVTNMKFGIAFPVGSDIMNPFPRLHYF